MSCGKFVAARVRVVSGCGRRCVWSRRRDCGAVCCVCCVRLVSSADRTVYYHKYPVTGPGSQTPIGWVTITARRAFCCGGLLCCYCGLSKSAS